MHIIDFHFLSSIRRSEEDGGDVTAGPFSFPSPLVPRGSSFIMWRDREALRCFSARGASAGVHYPFAPRHRRGGDHEVETAGGRY